MLPIANGTELSGMETFDPQRRCKVLVASPCLSMAQQWLVDQALKGLARFNVDTISPYDLGLDGNPVTSSRLEDVFQGCNAVLVLADGADIASVLAIGLARVRQLPVIVLAEEVKQLRVELWQGTDCEVARDLSSAVYRAMVAGRRNEQP